MKLYLTSAEQLRKLISVSNGRVSTGARRKRNDAIFTGRDNERHEINKLQQLTNWETDTFRTAAIPAVLGVMFAYSHTSTTSLLSDK